MYFEPTRRWALWPAALVVLAACSDSNPTGGAAGSLEDREAAELAEVVSSDAEAFVDASTYDPRHGLRLEIFRPMMGGPRAFIGMAGCDPVPSDSTPPNLDGDRVPDALLLDFNGVTCTVRDLEVSMAGTLGIEDPAVPGFGLRLIFSELNKTVSPLDRRGSKSVTWNGTRQIVGSPSNPGTQLTHTITNFRTTFVFPDGSSATHDKNWNGAFVADVAGSLQHGQHLPSGTWTFDGNSTWDRNDGARTYQVSITTLTPLHYNADCRVAPRFDAGVISAVVTRNGVTTTVLIEHPQCGEKIVTREGDT